MREACTLYCWRPGLSRKQACRNDSTEQEASGDQWGVGTTVHNEGPLECSSKFLKSQLLECEATTTFSLEAKCVCHYSRPFARAAAFAPARGTQSERTAGLVPAVSHTSLTQQIAPELPKPSPRPVLCWSCLHRSAESGLGSHQTQRRPVITRGWLAPCAPGRHPRSGLLQASPSHLPRLKTLSRAPLGALLSPPLLVLQPRSTPPTAAISRQTANEE